MEKFLLFSTFDFVPGQTRSPQMILLQCTEHLKDLFLFRWRSVTDSDSVFESMLKSHILLLFCGLSTQSLSGSRPASIVSGFVQLTDSYQPKQRQGKWLHLKQIVLYYSDIRALIILPADDIYKTLKSLSFVAVAVI